MIPYVVLGAVLGLPLLLGLIFRVSTSHLFFSLMAGELLARYFGEDVSILVNSFARSQNIADYAEAGVIVLPVILTAIFLRGSLSKGKVILHFIPLLITGVVFAAFILPVLPDVARDYVRSVEAGRQLLDMSSVIVGVVVLVQLIALWLLNRTHGHKKRR